LPFMPSEPISPATRDLLRNLRNLLLDQHKLLLDRERANYEAVHGPVGSPGQYLNLVLGHPHFAWLKNLSTLVVEIDEALFRKSTAGESEAQALLAQFRAVLLSGGAGTAFQACYQSAVSGSAEVAAMHRRIAELPGL